MNLKNYLVEHAKHICCTSMAVMSVRYASNQNLFHFFFACVCVCRNFRLGRKRCLIHRLHSSAKCQIKYIQRTWYEVCLNWCALGNMRAHLRRFGVQICELWQNGMFGVAGSRVAHSFELGESAYKCSFKHDMMNKLVRQNFEETAQRNCIEMKLQTSNSSTHTKNVLVTIKLKNEHIFCMFHIIRVPSWHTHKH